MAVARDKGRLIHNILQSAVSQQTDETKRIAAEGLKKLSRTQLMAVWLIIQFKVQDAFDSH
jgi:hypothetical protein